MNRVANHVDVVSHLMFPNQEEGDLGERVMSQEDAEVLVKRYKTVLEQGIRRGSYTYHVVDQILRHEKLDHKGKIFRHDEEWWFESSDHFKYTVDEMSSVFMAIGRDENKNAVATLLANGKAIIISVEY